STQPRGRALRHSCKEPPAPAPGAPPVRPSAVARATAFLSGFAPMVPPSRAVVEALVACRDPMACLALVLETEGSTYVGAGGMALFGDEPAQVGWLSGGCLEAGIAQAAAQAARAQRLEWLALDTRGDEALYAGSTPGCRGRLHLALLPLRALAPWPAMFAAWWQGRAVLRS